MQERGDVTVEQLTDALTDHLQGQAISPELRDQLGPIRVSARELLVGQQDLTFGNAQTAELKPAYRATGQHG